MITLRAALAGRVDRTERERSFHAEFALVAIREGYRHKWNGGSVAAMHFKPFFSDRQSCSSSAERDGVPLPAGRQASWRETKSREAEFMQNRSPVGLGPSSNTWPRWDPHSAQRTSTRRMP